MSCGHCTVNNRFFKTIMFDFRYEDGHIKLKQDCQFSHLKIPMLKREEHQHLYDTRIRSEEGKELRAHKCVLVARLEYFHSMLSGSWFEVIFSL